MSEPTRQAFDDSLAVLLPHKHCAFKGCTWEYGWDEACAADGPRLDDEKLLEHVMGARESSVLLAADLLPGCFPTKERIFATYNEAIAIKVREGAPLASYSIDRRRLRKYAETTSGDKIQAPICFLCACICPRGSAFAKNPIEWRRQSYTQICSSFQARKPPNLCLVVIRFWKSMEKTHWGILISRFAPRSSMTGGSTSRSATHM